MYNFKSCRTVSFVSMQETITVEAISVFDILKIGVGPSSSHTLGPWRAARAFVEELREKAELENVGSIVVKLYGSLALTGKGHGTDIAVMLGLSGKDPETIPLDEIQAVPSQIEMNRFLCLGGIHDTPFTPRENIVFLKGKKLPFHSNALSFSAFDQNGSEVLASVYYSTGGGFIVNDRDKESGVYADIILPYPSECAEDIVSHCADGKSIAQMVMQNELTWRSREEIEKRLRGIWHAMKSSVFKGCHTEGKLPGGLGVSRRASLLNTKLIKKRSYKNADKWLGIIKKGKYEFSDIIKWIGCFAMAVNEENANYGRIVTAPTNGSAGVIPAVLLYYLSFTKCEPVEEDIFNFLLVAGELGSLFKKGSTISAAMGGCQAEIGVSSAMAAGALTECMGGTVAQSLMAAEIAMEHHLGLTCDPVAGLVQIPCIERNCMGAVKAITASKIALDSDPAEAKVSLDNVIKTMWQTARDMNNKYKETSLGGLAANISVKVPEC